MARKTYDDEFKIAAAKLVAEQGYTGKNAAQSLGVDYRGVLQPPAAPFDARLSQSR